MSDKSNRAKWWKVEDFELSFSAPFGSHPEGDWLPATVPGGVYEDLMAAGRLPHPYRDRHEADVRWVEQRSWWYRATLHRPDMPDGHHLVLNFAGIDTVATVWIGGQERARHASQFRPLQVPLDALPDQAELLIRFDPPLAGLTEPEGPRATRDRMRAYFQAQGAFVGDELPSGVMSANMAVTLRRKALFSWGWDFAPHLPSIGLTGPVTLLAVPDSHINDVFWQTLEVKGEDAPARARLQVEVTARKPGQDLRWVLRDAEGQVTAQGQLGGAEETEVNIEHARLWWTHDLGQPSLYDLTVELSEGNEVIDRHTQKVGVRTIALDQGADNEGGHRFRFILNGVPIFARGANWVPASMLVGSVTAAQEQHLLRLARDAGMTMIRVWGGGLYGSDVFYDTCDELGLLVWQDFMFACVDYPDTDPELRAEVAAEADFQVSRLRSRASLALWCGNNEALALHVAIWGSEEPGGWGEYFYDTLLPQTVERLSPGALYWRGSPSGTPGKLNGVLDGDRHAWEIWHGGNLGAGDPPPGADHGEQVHFWRYRHDMGRFISEFGLHAAPEYSTLRRWTDEAVELGSPALLHRIKDTPKNKGAALLETETGTPGSMHDYITSSMMVQAEGLAYGIAHYRRRQPTCSGTLLWQLNEPWPGLSWSVIDYDGVPKAAWYALRRSYAPVVVSLRRDEDSGTVEVWLTNSVSQPWQGVLTARLSRFEGSVEAEITVQASAQGGESKLVATLPRPSDPHVVYAEVEDAAGSLPHARLFLDHIKHLPLDGMVDVQVRATEADRRAGCARVTVTASGFAYAVRVDPVGPEMKASDAYFDLPDGKSKTIELSGLPAGFDPASLEVRTWQSDHS